MTWIFIAMAMVLYLIFAMSIGIFLGRVTRRDKSFENSAELRAQMQEHREAVDRIIARARRGDNNKPV